MLSKEKILEDVADTLKLVNNVINDKDPNKSGKDKVENIHKTVKAQLKSKDTDQSFQRVNYSGRKKGRL